MVYRFYLAVPGLLSALICTSVSAAPVDVVASQVTATLKQLGVPVTGTFRKLGGEVVFDPTKPGTAKATLEIETASFDLGDKDYNAEVAKKDWFDARQFPKATFALVKVAPQGSGFVADGVLTIKGRMQKVQFPATVRRQGNQQVFEGKLPISRLAFSIGEGEWKDTSLVADEVVVQFRIVAVSQP